MIAEVEGRNDERERDGKDVDAENSAVTPAPTPTGSKSEVENELKSTEARPGTPVSLGFARSSPKNLSPSSDGMKEKPNLQVKVPPKQNTNPAAATVATSTTATSTPATTVTPATTLASTPSFILMDSVDSPIDTVEDEEDDDETTIFFLSLSRQIKPRLKLL